MSEEPKQNRATEQEVHPLSLTHRHALLALWLGMLALVFMGAALWVAHYLESREAHEQARQLVVARLERATGARIELSGVEWTLHRLEFELDGLQIHGTEAAGEPPLFVVERARAWLKLHELLAGRLVLKRLQVVHPVAHVVIYKDGSTNLPELKTRDQNQPSLQMSVDEADVLDGRLDWNQKSLRFDGIASGIFAQAARAPDGHYDCSARVGQVRMRTPQTEPLLLNAEAQFRFSHDRVEVSRLRVNERRWVLEASGTVDGLNSPVVQVAYRAAGDATELARILRYRELKGGTVQLSGQGTYTTASGEYVSVGKAQAAGVRWQNGTMRLEKVSGGFAFSLDGHTSGSPKPSLRDVVHLRIPSLFAVTLGGTVQGTMDTTFGPGKEESGRAALKIAGVDLQHAFAAFSTRQMRLERLPLAGQTHGALQVSWSGTPNNAQIVAELQVQPLSRPGLLPVTAVAQAAVDLKDNLVQVRRLDAHTDYTTLSAEGRLSSTSDLNVDLRTLRLSELNPLIASWRGNSVPLPIQFGDGAAFKGTMQGRLQSPALAGHLELHDFTTVLRIPAKLAGAAPASEHVARNRWDSLAGDVRYSASGVSLRNGLLTRRNTTIHVDASAGLVNGSYDPNLPLTARVRLQNGDAAQLQRLLGTAYPVTGTVDGELQLDGTARQLSGSGRVALRDASAWQQKVRSASADLTVSRSETGAGNQLRLRNIVVKSDAMQLTGNARINLDTTQFGFDLKGSEVRLERLRALNERNIALAGVAAFEAHGEGTHAAPVINGRLSLRNLAYKGQQLGAMDVQAITHGASMKLTARSNFKSAELSLDSDILLRGEMPMHLSGDLQSSRLNSLLGAYLPVRLEDPSLVKMHLEANGEAKRPREMTAEVSVDRLTASYGGLSMSNDGTIRLKVEHQVLRIEQFRMAGEQGNRFLRVGGDVQLAGQHEISLWSQGSVNLKLLQTMNPNLMSGGTANLNVQVNGTLDQPVMRGLLNVQSGSIAYIDFPNGLSDINGSLIFNEDRLQLQNLTARTGGGLLHCTGFLTYTPSQGVGFNLSATGSGIRLRYPEGLSSTADATLSLNGTRKDALLSGQVTITRLAVNPRFDFASYLVKGIRGTPVEALDSPLNSLHLDVRVISAQELQVQTSLARLSGNVDLRLRGTPLRPVVLGRVNLLEGTLEFNGTKYRVERGDLTFTNPVRIEPTVDMELSARVRDYDITLGFHGAIDKMTTTYRSDPPLSSSDIISLLALGVTAEEQANPAMLGTSQYQPAVTQSASGAVLGQALNAAVSSRVQKLFGVSRLKIDPNVGGAVNTGLARVTVEQQVSNKLTLTYISNLSQSAQEIIEFEYNVNKGVRIVGIRDQTGVVSVDVVFRKRAK